MLNENMAVTMYDYNKYVLHEPASRDIGKKSSVIVANSDIIPPSQNAIEICYSNENWNLEPALTQTNTE